MPNIYLNVKSIETHARAFLTLNILYIGTMPGFSISLIFQFNFSDGKNNNTCADNEFQCGSTLRKNKKCIPYDKVCDKEEDCPDGNLFF